MNSDEDDQEVRDVPVKVELAATAKATAIAKFERKTEVKIDVPKDVTRARTKAFLDAISPFTHSLGLVGDWLSDTRERLKIHRLQSLTAIADKARAQIEAQSVVPGQIPVKALLPMLERASLEEASDETLTSAWAALLASASICYDPEVIAFSRILSELSPRECLVLDHIYGERRDWVLGKRPPFAMRRFYESDETVKPMIREAVLAGDPALFSTLYKFIDPAMPIQFTIAITRATTPRVNWIDKTLREPFYAEHQTAFRLLEAQQLIQTNGQSYSWGNAEIPVAVDWVTLTELGAKFVARVTVPPPEEAPVADQQK